MAECSVNHRVNMRVNMRSGHINELVQFVNIVFINYWYLINKPLWPIKLFVCTTNLQPRETFPNIIDPLWGESTATITKRNTVMSQQKHLSHYWPFERRILRPLSNSWHKSPVIQSVDFSFVVSLNNLLSIYFNCQWFEMNNAHVMCIMETT